MTPLPQPNIHMETIPVPESIEVPRFATRRPALPSPRALLARTVLAAAVGALAAAALPAGAGAAVTAFGSSLSVPATKDTVHDLNYRGTDIPIPGRVVHVNHDGVDSALWNTVLAAGAPTAPASGQITSVRLEGCAQHAPGGPRPLTQIHFQGVRHQANGSYRAVVTSDPFDIPVCGVNGASGSTVTNYELRPTRVCVNAGDYIDFNDEGGFDPHSYPSGVPFQVIGEVAGSTMDAFLRHNGTGTGATFAPWDTSNHDGYTSTSGEELMLQATLATGSDASPACSGGTRGALPPATTPAQADGVNRSGVVRVAVFCHSVGPCSGQLFLQAPASSARSGKIARLGGAPFTVRAQRTGKVKVRLSRRALKMLRAHHGRLRVAAVVTSTDSTGQLKTFVGTIELFGGGRRRH